MKRLKLLFVLCVVVVPILFLLCRHKSSDLGSIRDVDFLKDYDQINSLFHKGDNWYWMICDAHQKSYSIEHMLTYKSSSQQQKKHDLVIKALEVDNKIVAFFAYYPHSVYVWQLLFLLVDQDYRKQGVGNRLLTYAVKDMIKRGAIKIILATRVDNKRAQSLYKKFGFKLLDADNEFAHLVFYKQ